jgi:hypothetical protein
MLDSNDQQTERQIVIAIIDRAVEEIKAKAAIVAERAERVAKRLADCLSFDDSDAGDRIRRYAEAHQRTMFRSLRELYKTRAETEEVEPTYVEDPGEGSAAPDLTNAPDAAYLRSREHALARSAQGCEDRAEHCGDLTSGRQTADPHADPNYWQDPHDEIQRPTQHDRYDPEAQFHLPITDDACNPPATEPGADSDRSDQSGRGNEPARPYGAAIELLLSLILMLTCATPSAGSSRRAAQPPREGPLACSDGALIGGKPVAIGASERQKNLGSKATCQNGSGSRRGAALAISMPGGAVRWPQDHWNSTSNPRVQGFRTLVPTLSVGAPVQDALRSRLRRRSRHCETAHAERESETFPRRSACHSREIVIMVG